MLKEDASLRYFHFFRDKELLNKFSIRESASCRWTEARFPDAPALKGLGKSWIRCSVKRARILLGGFFELLAGGMTQHVRSTWPCYAVCAFTALAGTGCDTGGTPKRASQKTTVSSPVVSLRPLPDKFYGVTLTSVDNPAPTIDALGGLPQKPMSRLAFAPNAPAQTYATVIAQLEPVSYLIGEIAPATSWGQFTPADYAARVTSYLDVLGDSVDVWEIGKDINTVASDATGIVAKINEAYTQVRKRRGRTALTLRYNDGCVSDPSAEMFTWAQQNVPLLIKRGVNFVFVSYLEEECNGLVPDWSVVFARLRTLFPYAKLGFGEVGTSVAESKAAFLQRYYSVTHADPAFVGGYFWRDFIADMVPRTMPLWQVLYDVMAGQAVGPGSRVETYPWYGVTVDDVSSLPEIVDSLKSLSRFPMTRIVFDPGVAATTYAPAVSAIHDVSLVMGEIVDSSSMKDYSLDQYVARAEEYYATLGDKVDVWEIGNEVNGEWTGNASDVAAKITAAYELALQQNKKTALTLYYNAGCISFPGEEMFTWVDANLPNDMRQNLDYVLVSYYEDDCNGLQPDWPVVFQRLRTVFPNAKLGIGEFGTEFPDRKEAYIRRYYNMPINDSGFIGGYFWWYFKQDMVPKTKPLWQTLDSVFAAGAVPSGTGSQP